MIPWDPNIIQPGKNAIQKRIYTYSPFVLSMRERDHQLAYEASRGNQDSWDTLYRESFSFVKSEVRKFDYQHFFCSSDYDDITDEAFTKCFEHLERYQGLSRFQRWVLGYAKNIMRNRRSTQLTAYRNRYLLEELEKSHVVYLDPQYFLIRLERDQNLWTAFSQLPLPGRTILYRRLFFNTPPRELAKELRLTRKEVLQHYESTLLLFRWHFQRLYQ